LSVDVGGQRGQSVIAALGDGNIEGCVAATSDLQLNVSGGFSVRQDGGIGAGGNGIGIKRAGGGEIIHHDAVSCG